MGEVIVEDKYVISLALWNDKNIPGLRFSLMIPLLQLLNLNQSILISSNLHIFLLTNVLRRRRERTCNGSRIRKGLNMLRENPMLLSLTKC